MKRLFVLSIGLFSALSAHAEASKSFEKNVWTNINALKELFKNNRQDPKSIYDLIKGEMDLLISLGKLDEKTRDTKLTLLASSLPVLTDNESEKSVLQKDAGWTKGQKAAATVVVAGVVLAGAALAFYKADPDRAIAMLEAAKARDLSTFTNIAKEVPQALRESEGYNSFLTTVSSNYSWAKESVANLISSIWQRVPSLPAWFKGSQAAEVVATEAPNVDALNYDNYINSTSTPSITNEIVAGGGYAQQNDPLAEWI